MKCPFRNEIIYLATHTDGKEIQVRQYEAEYTRAEWCDCYGGDCPYFGIYSKRCNRANRPYVNRNSYAVPQEAKEDDK
jgi:hypothetical protein